jgi:hypothetical protein
MVLRYAMNRQDEKVEALIEELSRIAVAAHDDLISIRRDDLRAVISRWASEIEREAIELDRELDRTGPR